MAIKFFLNEVYIKIPNRKKLKTFISDIFKAEGKPLSSLTYVFCTDKTLLSINNEFLHHDYYTDIITFSLADALGDPIVGEIYISADRIKDNAIQHGAKINNELHRVVFHGALHLCGYNDKNPPDKKKMTRMEDKYLKLYFD